MPRPIPVLHWPGPAGKIGVIEALMVFAIETPRTPIRNAARLRVRQALREILGQILGTEGALLPLLDQPGLPIRLDAPGASIGLSVSHEEGLSLIAIHLDGPVGVDLMSQRQARAVAADMGRMAVDYLGEKCAQRLALLPEALRLEAFAEAWVGLEAGLKCLGEGLSEWSPARQAALDTCTMAHLNLPAEYWGRLCWRTGPAPAPLESPA